MRATKWIMIAAVVAGAAPALAGETGEQQRPCTCQERGDHQASKDADRGERESERDRDRAAGAGGREPSDTEAAKAARASEKAKQQAFLQDVWTHQ